MKRKSKYQPGAIFPTKHGDVMILQKFNGRHVQIMFLEPPYSISTVQIGNLAVGSVANYPNNPEVKISAKKRHLAVMPDGAVSSIYSIWQRMKRDGREGAEIWPEWYDYQVFADWYVSQNRPETKEFRWIFTHRLIDRENDWYSPETCHVVPEPLVRTLNRFPKAETVKRAAEQYKHWISVDLYNQLMNWAPISNEL